MVVDTCLHVGSERGHDGIDDNENRVCLAYDTLQSGNVVGNAQELQTV